MALLMLRAPAMSVLFLAICVKLLSKGLPPFFPDITVLYYVQYTIIFQIFVYPYPFWSAALPFSCGVGRNLVAFFACSSLSVYDRLDQPLSKTNLAVFF